MHFVCMHFMAMVATIGIRKIHHLYSLVEFGLVKVSLATVIPRREKIKQY